MAACGSGALTLTESTTAPSGLPAGLTAASPTFTLAGATLTTPAEAVLQYQAAALGGLSSSRLAVYAQNASGGWTFVPALVGAGTVSVDAGRRPWSCWPTPRSSAIPRPRTGRSPTSTRCWRTGW